MLRDPNSNKVERPSNVWTNSSSCRSAFAFKSLLVVFGRTSSNQEQSAGTSSIRRVPVASGLFRSVKRSIGRSPSSGAGRVDQ
jgi:hypothetical protein